MRKILILIAITSLSSFAYSQTAKEIVQKSYDKLNGKSSTSTMSMTIVRPKWTRTVTMKSWANGTKYSMILITSPAKEKGQVFLKRDREMWNWVPKIQRMIKIPPSMMMQSWMGSDFTNDDLVQQTSIIVDYTHKLLREEKFYNHDCYVIELKAKEDAAVSWGKIITWIAKDELYTLKNEYYDEDNYLINTEKLENIKLMDDRKIPTKYTIIPEEEEGNKTILEFIETDFNAKIEESFFSQQNMKKIR